MCLMEPVMESSELQFPPARGEAVSLWSLKIGAR